MGEPPVTVTRRAPVLTSIVCVAAAIALVGLLSGCGGADTPVVASIQGQVISKESLAHWMRIENGQSQIPVPDPPAYRRCIAAANAVQRRSRLRRQLADGVLRARCAALYALLEHRALGFLITADWLELEASAQGLSVSSSEVVARYRQLMEGPAGGAFADSLRRRGMSRADELFQLRLEKLAEKLRAKIAPGFAGTSQRGVNAFVAAYRRRWRRRTICRPGYIAPECRNGPPLPSSPPG